MRAPVVVRTLPMLAAGVLLLLPAAVPAVPTDVVQSSLPVRFEPNVGQFAPDVRYAARVGAHRVLAKDGEVVLELRKAQPPISPRMRGPMRHRVMQRLMSPGTPVRKLRMRMSDSPPAAGVEHFDKTPGVVHYMVGSDRRHWRRDVPTYRGVRYRDVRRGADLLVYGNGERLEYDVVVRPGTKVQDIALEFVGADSMRLDEEGAVCIEADGFTVRHLPPRVYQEVAGRRHPVDGRYVVRGDGKLRFAVGVYLAQLPLVIDPIIELPGGGEGVSDFIAVDAAGNSYVTGMVLPGTHGAEDQSDVFVAMLPADGAEGWTVVFGGARNDLPNAIAFDAAGAASGLVYVAGSGASPDLPTPDTAAYGSYTGASYGGGISDAWVAKLDASSGMLLSVIYLGGNDNDFALGVTTDASARVYVTGGTASADFPVTANSAQPALSDSTDVFVTVLAPVPSGPPSLIYSTYLGGPGDDSAAGVVIDGAGVVSVAGETYGLEDEATGEVVNAFPTKSALQEAYGGGPADAFVASFSPSATDTLLASTYLGGAGYDYAVGLGLDAAGALYVAGATDLPGFSAGELSQAAGDGLLAARTFDTFVAKLTNAATQPELAFLTYVGGTEDEDATGIAVTPAGDVYLTGVTYSSDFPQALAVDVPVTGAEGDGEVFVVKLALTPLSPEPVLLYTTSLGSAGIAQNAALGVVLAPNGDVLVAGSNGEGAGDRITSAPVVVSIDIRQEAINPGKKGVIPVAILPSATFDPESQVDRTSLTFGHTGDEPSLRHCEGRKPASRPTGKPLVCHFDERTAGFLAEDTHGILKGSTLSGAVVFGADTVRIAPPKDPRVHWHKTKAVPGKRHWGDCSREERLARAPGRR